MTADHLIITVHGIRTFGQWQERLETLARTSGNKEFERIEWMHYKFGYFSVLAFLIPPLRWLVVRRFRQELRSKCAERHWRRVDLVGHSFGTHLIGWSLFGLREHLEIKIHTVILAGSVLRSGFPWRELMGKTVHRVANDCGSRDKVLLLSQFCVLFTGMAGRIGFSGGTGALFRNRFSQFGHGGYFDIAEEIPSASYMSTQWLPLILGDADAIQPLDLRPPPSALSGVFTTLANNMEPIKITIYVVPLLLFAMWVLAQRQAAISSRNDLARQSAQGWFTLANRDYNNNPDPLTAFLLTSRALSVAPSDDPNRATYFARLLALAPLVPTAKANFGDIARARIDAGSGLVVTQRNEGAIESWTTQGQRLPALSVPIVINGGLVYGDEPAIRSDGRYAAVVTPNGNFVGDLQLILWDLHSGRVIIQHPSTLIFPPTFGPHGWLAHLESTNATANSQDDILRVWKLGAESSPSFRDIPGGISLAPEDAAVPLVAVERDDGLHFIDLDNPDHDYGPFLAGMRLMNSVWTADTTLLVTAEKYNTGGIYQCGVAGCRPATEMSTLSDDGLQTSRCGDIFSLGKIVWRGVVHSEPSLDQFDEPCITDAGLVVGRSRSSGQWRRFTAITQLAQFPAADQSVARTIVGEAVALDFEQSAQSIWTVSNHGLLLQWPVLRPEGTSRLGEVPLGTSESFQTWTATSRRNDSIAVALGKAKAVEVFVWTRKQGEFAGPFVVPFDVPKGVQDDLAADPRMILGQIAAFGFDPTGTRLLLGTAEKVSVVDAFTGAALMSFRPNGGELVEDAVLGTSQLGVVYRSGGVQLIPLKNGGSKVQSNRCQLPRSATFRGFSADGSLVIVTQSNVIELWSIEPCEVVGTVNGAADEATTSLVVLMISQAGSLRSDQGQIVARLSGRDFTITQQAGLVTILGPDGALIGPTSGMAVAVSSDLRRGAFRSSDTSLVDQVIDLHTGFKINTAPINVLGRNFATNAAIHTNWGVMFGEDGEELFYVERFSQPNEHLAIQSLTIGPETIETAPWVESIGTGVTGLAVRDDGALYFPTDGSNVVETFKRDLVSAAGGGDATARMLLRRLDNRFK